MQPESASNSHEPVAKQPKQILGAPHTKAITVRMPCSVYEQAKQFASVSQPETAGAFSLNDFFVASITAYVALLRRREIDAAFAVMGKDADYQKDAELLLEAFRDSDGEALGLGGFEKQA